jgi:hypothetical protein
MRLRESAMPSSAAAEVAVPVTATCPYFASVKPWLTAMIALSRTSWTLPCRAAFFVMSRGACGHADQGCRGHPVRTPPYRANCRRRTTCSCRAGRSTLRMRSKGNIKISCRATRTSVMPWRSSGTLYVPFGASSWAFLFLSRGDSQAGRHAGVVAASWHQAAQESFTAMPVATTRLRFTPVSSIRMTPSLR